MEEISVKIKEASWYEVVDYLKTNEKSEVKSKLYHKLSRLYEIFSRANEVTHGAWFKNYKTPKIDYVDWDKLHLSVTRYEKFKEEIDILNGTIYNHLLKLDDDIVDYIKRYYSLGCAYRQADKDYIPSMFDKESIKMELKQKLSKNMFEDKDVAKNVLDTYYYLLELQGILQKVKDICENEDVEKMLKLISCTKSQLKQVVFDLGCRLFATSTNEIEIAKRLPEGTDKTLYYIQQSGMKSLNK